MNLPEDGRVGLLGGTFDPPHYGHLALASEAAYRFGLESLILYPARTPPHKEAPEARLSARMEMLRLATSGSGVLRVRDLEGETGASYSADLLQALGLSPERVWFVVGMDSLLDLESWKTPQRLLRLASVVAGTRPGFDPEEVPELARGRVDVFPLPGLWISSSELRHRFARGRPTAYLTPEAVRHYIMEEGLYGAGR